MIQRCWWPVLVLAGGCVTAAAVESWLFKGWLGGFLAGILCAAAFFLPAYLIISVSGTWSLMEGADAERQTSAELRRSAPKGWLAVDDIPLKTGQIDHALVGTSRGLAFETKWSSRPWELGANDDRLQGAAAQAVASAARLQKWARFQLGLELSAEPVVVLWGRLADPDASPARLSGATVLHGSQLRSWLRNLPAQPLDHRELADRRERIDAALRTMTARQASPAGWFVRDGIARSASALCWMAAAAAIGFVFAATLLGVDALPFGIRMGMSASATLLGLLARRSSRYRHIAVPWAVASGLPVVLIGAAWLIDTFRA